MTTKKPKRAAKPRPLRGWNRRAAAWCHEMTTGDRLVFINWNAFDAKDARRLKAWLPGAIAWCEDTAKKEDSDA